MLLHGNKAECAAAGEEGLMLIKLQGDHVQEKHVKQPGGT